LGLSANGNVFGRELGLPVPKKQLSNKRGYSWRNTCKKNNLSCRTFFSGCLFNPTKSCGDQLGENMDPCQSVAFSVSQPRGSLDGQRKAEKTFAKVDSLRYTASQSFMALRRKELGAKRLLLLNPEKRRKK